MKIKFIKEFKYPGFDISSGAIKDSENYGFQNEVKGWFQWLIDNGFAEKVEENRQLFSDASLNKNASIVNVLFQRSQTDDGTAQRFVDYLNAVNTVIQDKGIMTTDKRNGYAWGIIMDDSGGVDITTSKPAAGSLYFEWSGDAWASIKNHPDEWKIIANYDWSKE